MIVKSKCNVKSRHAVKILKFYLVKFEFPVLLKMQQYRDFEHEKLFKLNNLRYYVVNSRISVLLRSRLMC